MIHIIDLTPYNKKRGKRVKETDVEQNVVKQIEKAGGICYKFTSPQRRNVPDRLCVMPAAKTFFIECKAPGKKPTSAQVREHERLRALGYYVLVVDDPEWKYILVL